MIDFSIVKDFNTLCERACDLMPELKPHKEELLRFAQQHERRQLCLQNVCSQVQQVERAFRTSGPDKMRRMRNETIASCAQMFMKAIKDYRDLQNESLMSKVVRQQDRQKKEAVAELIREVPPDTH